MKDIIVGRKKEREGEDTTKHTVSFGLKVKSYDLEEEWG